MKRLILLAPSVALIFACSSNTAQNNASASANTTAAVAVPPAGSAASMGSVALQPGEWEMTATINDMQVPGAPPELAAQMKQASAMANNAGPQRQCITPEEAANMGARMLSSSANGTNCTFRNQTFAGGTIDMAGSCQGPQGNVDMQMQGTYTETTMNVRSVMNIQGGPQQVMIDSNVAGRRVGECTAATPQNAPAQPGAAAAAPEPAAE